MSPLHSRASAPYRPPFGDRRDGVPAASKPARSLRRSHLPPVNTASVSPTLSTRAAAMPSTAPPLRPTRPGLLLSRQTPTQTLRAPPAFTAPKPSQPRSMGPSALPSKPHPPRKTRTIQSMLFCASLQDHAVWGPVVPLLQASKTQPGWAKAHLSSHDLSVSVGYDGADTTIRFVLMTAGDVGQPDTTKRLQRLAARKNGEGAVVFFLLKADDSVDTMSAYGQLQDELLQTAVSILPLTAVETLLATVAAICGQLTAAVAEPDDSKDRIYKVLRMHFGDAVPVSAEGAKRLVAACKAEARQPVALHDVIAFGERLKQSGRLEDVLGDHH